LAYPARPLSAAMVQWFALVHTAVMVEESGLLADVKTVVDIVGTTVTAAAVVVGGLWAYFKFVKGRTYRPRLEVGMSGRWRNVDGRKLIHARVAVRNIGASVVTLIHEGTGLRISVLAVDQDPPPAAMAWTSMRVFEILKEHEWIEPGETVSDDVLLDLGVSESLPLLFESRLVWQLSGRQSDQVVVFARQVIPVDSILEGSSEERPQSDAAEKESQL
jgi:hypothetical protein